MEITKPAFAALAAATLLFAAPATADDAAQSGAEVGKWTQDYQAALRLAAEKDVPVFLKFTGSDWCGWCKLMEKNVFREPAFSDWAATNAVLVSIDFPQAENVPTVPEAFKARNRHLAQVYGVQGFPTYFVLSPSGKTLGTLGASRDATAGAFVAAGSEIAAKGRTAPKD